MLRRFLILSLAIGSGLFFFACNAEQKEGEPMEETAETTAVESGVVNVYTHRHYPADKELFAEFTKQTGIEVNVVSAGADELIKRLETEGDQSPADLLVTVDASRLHRAKALNLLQPVSTPTLQQNVPAHLRDKDNEWYGLTVRARIVAYAPDRVDPTKLQTYAALANKEWKGKLLIRSSSNEYNQSLMAAMIEHKGAEKAAEWAKGIVDNMARTPAGNDRDQMKGIAAGLGDIAVVNSYYYNMMKNSDDQAERDAASKVEVTFPHFEDGGIHINVSGAGVTKNAANAENAIKLLEFLTSDAAQRKFAEANFEYALKDEIEYDGIGLDKLGENNEKAVMIFDQVGWK